MNRKWFPRFAGRHRLCRICSLLSHSRLNEMTGALEMWHPFGSVPPRGCSQGTLGPLSQADMPVCLPWMIYERPEWQERRARLEQEKRGKETDEEEAAAWISRVADGCLSAQTRVKVCVCVCVRVCAISPVIQSSHHFVFNQVKSMIFVWPRITNHRAAWINNGVESLGPGLISIISLGAAPEKGDGRGR